MTQPTGAVLRLAATMTAAASMLFLALYNLTDYPAIWFDEGLHLHVPKDLVRFGIFAADNGTGVHHYAAVSVGPTVLLPLVAVFRVFGIGLLQARLVIACYLLAAVVVFFLLARGLGGQRFAWVSAALLVSSPSVGLVPYGRQVLGEVPGFVFLAGGLALWFRAWERARLRELGMAGLLLGLAMITKPQYAVVTAPALGLSWLANLMYYRSTPQRVFLVPCLCGGACVVLWQVSFAAYLGPSAAAANLAELRESAAGAVVVFSRDLMQHSLRELLSPKVYLGCLPLALVYGFMVMLPVRREAQQWGVLLLLVVTNLGWYAIASIGWLRYAFPALALAALFVARLFRDLTDGFRLVRAVPGETVSWRKAALRYALMLWLAVMITVPLLRTAWDVAEPPFNAPSAMAAYLNEHVSRVAVIETWEPELGFLTDHAYHFPPQHLLDVAVAHVWRGGPAPSRAYDFVEREAPDYVLVGEFARWVDLYPASVLAARYRLVTTVGAYELFARNDASPSREEH